MTEKIVESVTNVDYEMLTVYQQDMIALQVISFFMIATILAFK